MNQVASRIAGFAAIVAIIGGCILLFLSAWFSKRDAPIVERAEARRSDRVYTLLHSAVLEALTDSTSAEDAAQESVSEWLARSERPRSPSDSARADAITERILDEMLSNPEDFAAWLKD